MEGNQSTRVLSGSIWTDRESSFIPVNPAPGQQTDTFTKSGPPGNCKTVTTSLHQRNHMIIQTFHRKLSSYGNHHNNLSFTRKTHEKRTATGPAS